jgi:hypothetical protein
VNSFAPLRELDRNVHAASVIGDGGGTSSGNLRNLRELLSLRRVIANPWPVASPNPTMPRTVFSSIGTATKTASPRRSDANVLNHAESSESSGANNHAVVLCHALSTILARSALNDTTVGNSSTPTNSCKAATAGFSDFSCFGSTCCKVGRECDAVWFEPAWRIDCACIHQQGKGERWQC